jgi:hypothetical protein
LAAHWAAETAGRWAEQLVACSVVLKAAKKAVWKAAKMVALLEPWLVVRRVALRAALTVG